MKLYHGVSRSFCQSKEFELYLKEFHGCSQPQSSKRQKGIRAVTHFHSDHPRCHRSKISNYCSYEGLITTLTPSFIAFSHFPFIINTTFPIVVSRGGMLVTRCRILGLFNSCKGHSYNLYSSLLDGPTSNNRSVSLCYTSAVTECLFPTVKVLFIASQYDDTQIGQFFLESLPRIVYHLDYLLANPHIRIHYGFNKKHSLNPILPQSLLAYQYLDFIGLDRNRLVTGPTRVTKYALLPREGGCQDASYTSWELHVMRNRLLQFSDIHLTSSQFPGLVSSTALGQPFPRSTNESCNVLVLFRTITKYSQNLFDRKRRFSQDILQMILSTFHLENHTKSICSHFSQTSFQKMYIRVFSDDNQILMKCISCQIKLFSQANLVIGVHGAGLMNTIFMSKGSVVIEIVPQDGMDSRHVPINGISAIFGLHHYLYLDDLTSSQFPHRLLENIITYLKSFPENNHSYPRGSRQMRMTNIAN